MKTKILTKTIAFIVPVLLFSCGQETTTGQPSVMMHDLIGESSTNINTQTQTLDLTVRNKETKTVIQCSMINSVNEDTVFLKGTVSSFDGLNSVPILVSLPKSEIDKIHLNELDSTIVFKENSNAKSTYAISDYSINSAMGNKYRVLSGKFLDANGKELEFVASTDPVPVVVIVAGIGAVACIAIIAIDRLTTDCEAVLKSAIDACKESGKSPNIVITTNFGISFDPFKLGCSSDCKLDCK